jgi:hypothetical protein
VTLKIKTDKFSTKTRVKTLFDHTCDLRVIESASKSLLRQFIEEMKPMTLRLMGVREGYTKLL